MTDTVLLVDIGGTHARARLMEVSGDLFVDRQILKENISTVSDKPSLFAIISDFQSQPGSRIVSSVLSFAGPVRNDSITMTNWPNTDNISLGEMAALGLPRDRTIFINDMEAAANGLIAYKMGMVELEVRELYAPKDPAYLHFNNSILIIPGTGVGIAAVILPRADEPSQSPAHISCEIQHTTVSELDEKYSDLVTGLKLDLNKTMLSWEDFVSGRGLENIYRILSRSSAGQTGEKLTAADIAKNAIAGIDNTSMAALDCYYSIAGRLTQVVALAFQPFAGIYLAGGTTRKNLPFIGGSGYMENLHNNPVREELLKTFPVYLMPEYMNLIGAMYLANTQIRASKK